MESIHQIYWDIRLFFLCHMITGIKQLRQKHCNLHWQDSFSETVFPQGRNNEEKRGSLNLLMHDRSIEFETKEKYNTINRWHAVYTSRTKWKKKKKKQRVHLGNMRPVRARPAKSTWIKQHILEKVFGHLSMISSYCLESLTYMTFVLRKDQIKSQVRVK